MAGVLKYGKKDAVESPFTEFKNCFAEPVTQLASPFAHYGGRVQTPWEMDGNGPDPSVTIAPSGWGGCGNCTEVGRRNFIALTNYYPEIAVSSRLAIPTANDVVETYCADVNCTPQQLFSDPDLYDTGEDEVSLLTKWGTMVQYGTKLAYTGPVDVKNQVDLKNGIFLGGGLYIGIQAPESMQEQFSAGQELTWVPSSPTEGGHCVVLTGYTEDYVALVTWGQCVRATWEFVMNVIDEAHVLILPPAVAAGTSPTGLQIANWESDLNNLAA